MLYLIFFYENANNMCNWCCLCEKKMWMFYFLFTTYQCIYTVGCYKNIMLIPSVNSFIILVLNHWFLNFFSKQYLHVYVILVCFFEADSEAKTYLFKLFFYIEDLLKLFFFCRDMTFNFDQCCDLDLSFTFYSIRSCPL